MAAARMRRLVLGLGILSLGGCGPAVPADPQVAACVVTARLARGFKNPIGVRGDVRRPAPHRVRVAYETTNSFNVPIEGWIWCTFDAEASGAPVLAAAEIDGVVLSHADVATVNRKLAEPAGP